MQRLLTWILLAVVSTFGGWNLSATAETPSKGVIRVKLSPETAATVGHQTRLKSKGKLTIGTTPLDRAAKSVNAVSIRPMLPYSEKFAEQRAKYGLDCWYVVTFDEAVSSLDARKTFAAVEGVERSEVVTPMSLKEGNKGFRYATPSKASKAATGVPFNDPMLSSQWHYNNDGTIPYSVAGADINLFKAWNTSTGSDNVVVAIIDGGIDYTHEDLAKAVYVNEAELNGQAGVDDDGDGYVDNIYGYNFCTNSGEVYPHQHGTHVAGTVGAVNNNGIGVCGVAGGDGSDGSGVKLLSCQVFDSRSGTGDADFAAAIVYAAEHGATIAQCSWGWEAEGYYEQAVLSAIDYFTDSAKSNNMTGGLCIFAAGNDGATGKFYPACYDKVVAVGSMTSELTPASYSNYGDWVDIMAPGGDMDYGDAQGILSTLPSDKYGYNEGTSMATPHVSGVAALILSKYGSSTFTNESLRTQLLTSVNDFYGYGSNSKYEGLYGSGYIDAAKALQMDNTGAPEVVSDLELLAAQDNITVTWTIPASNDNNVNNHIIYWSTDPFTAESDLSNVSQVVVDTKFLNSGDSYSYELKDLKSLTTYYVAIRAVNRWGNASDLSEVKSATTNAGPSMTVSKSSLSMTSTANVPVASASFEIGNTEEGLLKWESYKRTVSATLKSVLRPNIGNVKPFAGNLGFSTIHAKASSTVAAEYEAEDYPKLLNYYDEDWAYIGETDKTLPNSMAQWFKVDASTYPEGFNLTHITFNSSYGKNPKIEIYKGDANISQATLLQSVSYSYWYSGYSVPLNEQLYFSPGESFWIVVHFDAGQSGYPLPIAKATTSGIATYSYMSNDNGATWTQLAAALKGSSYETDATNYTWAITAKSNNPDWSEFVELNPSEGTVKQNETQTVETKVDGAKLVNGTYKFNLKFNTNETEPAISSIPVSLTVSGNTPNIKVPKVVDFGSLLVGQSKTLEVEVYNAGYGSMRGSTWSAGIYSNNITSNSANFTGPDYVSNGFPARTSVTVELTYTPTEAGSHSGAISFKDGSGNSFSILVQGVATDPAKVQVEPTTIDAGTLNVGDEPTEASFTISNLGKYPLEYVFPKFSDEQIDGSTATLHKFGYSVSSNLPGYDSFEYDNNPDLISATNIASSFSDNVYLSSPISIGFSFPYYGKNYDKAYITSFGGIMFAENSSTLRGTLTPNSFGIDGTGFIAAYGSQLLMNANSKVEYARQDGKFVVKFSNVLASVYDSDYTPISFHMALSANGDVEIFYDDYDHSSVFQSGSGLFCGINDPELEDVVTVTSSDMADYWGSQDPTAENTRFQSFASGTAVKFEAPKTSFVSKLSAPHGLVSPGESVVVKATLQATDEMNAGDTYNNLVIVTNDPNPEVTAVRINATIAGEGLVAEPSIEKEAYDFGQAYRTSSVLIPVTVTNGGHSSMTINSASVAGSQLSVQTELPSEVPAGYSRDIVVKVNTETEGAVNDVISISTSAGDLSATISGTVIGCPDATLSFEAINETVASGEELVKTLEITNNGNEPLVYSIEPVDNVTVTAPERDDTKTSYVYSSKVDDGIDFSWEDIETTGLGTQNAYEYYINHDFVEVELPFEFPFYGKKYSKMYIYNTGFVSFTERHDDKIWPEPPSEFPTGSIYTNIIAPYWGLHSMNTTKSAGTYHYITEDRAVVSFMEYGNSMNYGVCYQLIMEKDGSFKFQYKAYDDSSVIYAPFGLAGIANTDGSEYIQLAERQMAFNNAVLFSPVRENTLAAGATDQVTLDVNTARMAGNYQMDVTMATNVPNKESIVIPVNVTITGEAAPVFPEDITVEHTLGYTSTDYSNPLVQMGACYDAEFVVKNEGTAPFTITSIDVNSPTYEDDWFGDEYPYFYLYGYLESTDWWTGEPTGDYAWGQYYGSSITVGETPAQFSIPMTQNDLWYTPGEYNVGLTFNYVLGDDYDNVLQKSMNVKFIVTECPSMTLDKNEISFSNVDDDFSATDSFTIGNEGEYKLTYSLALDATGVGEETDDDLDGGIAMWNKAKKTVATPTGVYKELLASAINTPIKPLQTSDNAFNAPKDVEFSNALYYDAMPGNTDTYNYGAGTTYDVYKAATEFTTPAEGFNISHIYTAITTETAKNVDVKFEIIQGSEPDGETVLGKGSLFIPSSNGGNFYMVELDKPVYMNPGEEFCVVATFPTGLKYPTYVCKKQEPVTAGRYMGWTQAADWFDMAQVFEDSYGSLGYIMSCIETTPGEPWVKLLTAETEGTINPSESLEVKVAVNAPAARMEKGNKAVIVIKSNDPNQPVVNFPIYLDINGTPTIEANSDNISAKENQTTSVVVTVADPDQDDLEIALTDASGLASIKAVTAADDAEAVIAKNENGVYSVANVMGNVAVEVEIAPNYGDAGSDYSFSISAADVKGHSITKDFYYSVEKVNRAPIANDDMKAVEVALGSLSEPVSFSNYFTDPDGDELSYDFSFNSTNIADAYTTTEGVIFQGKKVGKASATLVATDKEGLSASTTIEVVVKEESAVADIVGDGSRLVTLKENVVENALNAISHFSGKGSFEIFDAAGAAVYNATLEAVASETLTINLGDYAAGVYIFRVSAADKSETYRFLKK